MGKKRSKSNNADRIKKDFSIHDLKRVNPLTDKQSDLFEKYQHNPDKHMLLKGSAGTGKTFLAVYLALNDIFNGHYDKLVIIRSSVQTRQQGFLKGDAQEKMAEFMSPYIQIWDELFKYSKSFENMMKLEMVDFDSTSFIRGVTFNNAIVIVDEAQNMRFNELDTVITRIGEKSKIIICGDTKQDDLVVNKYDRSGFAEMCDILKSMDKYFETVEFTYDDIVRSKMVKEYIMRKEKYNV